MTGGNYWGHAAPSRAARARPRGGAERAARAGPAFPPLAGHAGSCSSLLSPFAVPCAAGGLQLSLIHI